MRQMRRRNLISYFFILALSAFLVMFYALSVKEDKQTGNNFNPKSPRNKWDSVRHYQYKYVDTTEENVKNSINQLTEVDTREIENSLTVGRSSKDKQNAEEEHLPLNVYVFEEHHEALPYWFRAANKGSIPKTGNTLLHIDGHSDMAPPVFFHGYPFFKWPTKKQIKFLMQRNDAFIQSSIMTGLITRMIWVWPEWDRTNHEKDYVMSTVKLGWTLVNTTDSPGRRRQIVFCMCQKTELKFECIYPKESDELGIEEVFVDPKECHIKKVVLVEEINEQAAIEFLKQKDWINESENVMLDVDEDFFGCSYVIKPLLDTNISMEKVRSVDDNLRTIICPKTTVHEEQTNKLILQTVALIRQQKACNIKHTSKCLDSSLKIAADEYLTNLLKDAKRTNKTNFCFYRGKQVNYRYYVKRFVTGLSKFTTEQLRIIYEIGFCSTTTPKTLRIFGEPEFGLCYGANTPAESAVTEFNPTSDNITKRGVILGNVFSELKNYLPKVVTLCRSIRDGYTPRQYFTRIENDILTSLNNTFRNIKLYYDKDLLGGKKGRPVQQQ